MHLPCFRHARHNESFRARQKADETRQPKKLHRSNSRTNTDATRPQSSGDVVERQVMITPSHLGGGQSFGETGMLEGGDEFLSPVNITSPDRPTSTPTHNTHNARPQSCTLCCRLSLLCAKTWWSWNKLQTLIEVELG